MYRYSASYVSNKTTENPEVIIESLVDYHPNVDTIIHTLGGVKFWGAQTYMYVNILHFLACALVVTIYCFLPEINKNLYNRIVLRHNVSLLMLGGILTGLAFFQLNELPVSDVAIRLLWLLLQYFTNATVFWLNVICFDMTLMITRLCWIPLTGNREEENEKLAVYSIFAWGGAFVPTVTAAVFEFVPQIPDDFPLKANFTAATNGPRPIVNMYFFFVPACTLFCNNILFALTTYNILKVQRSTELAVRHQERLLKKKYFLFLRLYLFMGAPWFFGTVLACFNELVVLKACRMLQPVLWLTMFATRREIRRQLTKRFKWTRRDEEIGTVSKKIAENCQPKDGVEFKKVLQS